MNSNKKQQHKTHANNNTNRRCDATRKRMPHQGYSFEESNLPAVEPIHPIFNDRREEAAATSPQAQRLPVRARLGAPVKRIPVPVAEPPTVHHSPELDNTQCLNLAILPGDYPSELWSVAQLEAVQQSIIDLIRRQDDKVVKPQFNGCAFRQGWLSVKCNDSYTVNWLRAMDTRLRPWEGASLQVISESEMPLKRAFVGIFPALQTNSIKYALQLIYEQNEVLTNFHN